MNGPRLEHVGRLNTIGCTFLLSAKKSKGSDEKSQKVRLPTEITTGKRQKSNTSPRNTNLMTFCITNLIL